MEHLLASAIAVLEQSAWIVFGIIVGVLYIMQTLRGIRETLAVALGSTIGMTLYFLQEFSVPTWLPVTDIVFQRLLALVLVTISVAMCVRALVPLYKNTPTLIATIVFGSVGVALLVERLSGISAVPPVMNDILGPTIQVLWWALTALIIVSAVFLEKRI